MAFSFKSVGHFFASAFGVYKKALQFADVEGAKAISLEPVAEGIAASVSASTGSPAPILIERAGETALGLVMSLVHTAETATGDAQKAAAGKLASLTDDQTVISDFTQLYRVSKADLAKLGFGL